MIRTTPLRAAPKYRAWEAYAEPLGDIEGVEGRLPELADQLIRPLERDGHGATALTLTGFRTDGGATRLSVRMGRPGRERARSPAAWRNASVGGCSTPGRHA